MCAAAADYRASMQLQEQARAVQGHLPPPGVMRGTMQEAQDGDVKRRRAVVVASLVGATSMGAVTLLQTGVIKHLPDPPIRSFDSDKITLSDIAYKFGAPDGAIALLGFAMNVALVSFGARNRASAQPWLWFPIAATAKALVDVGLSSRYFYQMPVKEKAWCGYCIVTTAANYTVLALSLPEALCAVRTLRRGAKA